MRLSCAIKFWPARAGPGCGRISRLHCSFIDALRISRLHWWISVDSNGIRQSVPHPPICAPHPPICGTASASLRGAVPHPWMPKGIRGISPVNMFLLGIMEPSLAAHLSPKIADSRQEMREGHFCAAFDGLSCFGQGWFHQSRLTRFESRPSGMRSQREWGENGLDRSYDIGEIGLN
jgi:hypothetical protein